MPKIKPHITILIVLFLLVMSGGLWIGTITFLALFVSVLLHELGHVWAARRCGIEASSISLNFLGGIAFLEDEPVGIRDQVFVALAGPAVNVLLFLPCLAFFWIYPESILDLHNPLLIFAAIQVVLCIFNMTILMPPLDGGRAFSAAARLVIKDMRMANYFSMVIGMCTVGAWASILGIDGAIILPVVVLLGLHHCFVMDAAIFDGERSVSTLMRQISRVRSSRIFIDVGDRKYYTVKTTHFLSSLKDKSGEDPRVLLRSMGYFARLWGTPVDSPRGDAPARQDVSTSQEAAE